MNMTPTHWIPHFIFSQSTHESMLLQFASSSCPSLSLLPSAYHLETSKGSPCICGLADRVAALPTPRGTCLTRVCNVAARTRQMCREYLTLSRGGWCKYVLSSFKWLQTSLTETEAKMVTAQSKGVKFMSSGNENSGRSHLRAGH